LKNAQNFDSSKVFFQIMDWIIQEKIMFIHSCGKCSFRAKYDNNPKSFLGRIWRWHTEWCPGWRRHITSLPAKERIKLAAKYDMEKYTYN